MLSSSRCSISDLLVWLPHQGCYLRYMTVCWPFLWLEFLCVFLYVWNPFLLRGFQYLSNFPQNCKFQWCFIYISSFLISHGWIRDFATLMMCLDKPFSSCSLPLFMGKPPLFLLWSFTAGAHFPGRTLEFQSRVPLGGFQLHCLFCRRFAFQACQLVSDKSVAYILAVLYYMLAL